MPVILIKHLNKYLLSLSGITTFVTGVISYGTFMFNNTLKNNVSFTNITIYTRKELATVTQ